MFKKYRHTLIMKMLLSGGVTLLLSVILWTSFNVVFFKKNVTGNIQSDIAMLSDTVLLSLHHAMMLDSKEFIQNDINNISRQGEIKSIRVINKKGQIIYSNDPDEILNVIDIKSPPCWNCHQLDNPPATMSLEQRTRLKTINGKKFMGIMTPIPNSEGCAPGPCHVHAKDEQLLGLLDLEISTEKKDSILTTFEQANFGIALVVFIATFGALFVFAYNFIFKPIRTLITATRKFGSAQDFVEIQLAQTDEIGTLADAFNMMGRQVQEKHRALLEQKEEYRDLFDNVPCLVSVVDLNFKVIRHNKAYEKHFGKPRGRQCYQINKDRDRKCEECPVERTFFDLTPHMSEESGLSKDGKPIHWIVYTSPIKDREGKIVAAMEMMLDITRRKELEESLAASELRYHAIFDSIPQAVFVLDAEDLTILNCNDPVEEIYGYSRDMILGSSFLKLFREEEQNDYEHLIKVRKEIGPCSHLTKSGNTIYAMLRISPAEFDGNRTLIVTCSDVTQKLEAEQQLIQASKMSTLGEMASGVAHELNQPLAILKTISNLLMRKVTRNQQVEPKVLKEMAEGVDTHVNRASKIIEHMREFGRKSDMKTMPVQVNDVLRRGFDFFSRQLTLRNISVEWNLNSHLPIIKADSNRLEQVVINLLINARDAIEERWKDSVPLADNKKIYITTDFTDENVVIEICDTGPGIPDPIQTRLFEPFFTTKDVGKGTGLGLSISYGIIKDYNGTISASTKEDLGACFTITFPRGDIGED
ncbi:PAS domain S-box protein [Maridesulfovibrio salexigens]|uniref:histidine kinase n=1 Tax=Maridesulfovibrio salexigens (strain ATCC 14822 / DSM 2638 / NCIMB 8403 / VKM B-1763) TaxID=526222 RepID=C6BRI9_MARSD|nr:PAS domain S-box protein [Maridesulfovibrio salexigens]ACS79429.1 PAS/PAC sensor signal transduction histidine kinase [Maridesulfovibrio salexigens DSM 2638]